MRNPWLKKNPFMSMWLSAANTAAGSARAQATSAARRQVAATQAEATRQVLEFWTGKPSAQAAPKKPSAKAAPKKSTAKASPKKRRPSR